MLLLFSIQLQKTGKTYLFSRYLPLPQWLHVLAHFPEVISKLNTLSVSLGYLAKS